MFTGTAVSNLKFFSDEMNRSTQYRRSSLRFYNWPRARSLTQIFEFYWYQWNYWPEFFNQGLIHWHLTLLLGILLHACADERKLWPRRARCMVGIAFKFASLSYTAYWMPVSIVELDCTLNSCVLLISHYAVVIITDTVHFLWHVSINFVYRIDLHSRTNGFFG